MKTISMGKYFSVNELCKSNTADRLKIDNTPSKEVVEHLEEVIRFLDPIRESWGSAIRVTSGYRCPRLNSIVGGSKTSAHLVGYAVDLQPVKGTVDQLFYFLRNYLINGKNWDQLIIEKSGKTKWVHLGLKSRSGKQRRQIFSLNV